MKPLNELFEVAYGNKLDLNKLERMARESGGINFVGRSSQNNGVSGVVRPIPGIAPYPNGLITVALGIRKNRFRYSAFGREANRTLRTLSVPCVEEFPDWIKGYDPSSLGDREKAVTPGLKSVKLRVDEWVPFTYGDLFEIRKGQRLTKANMLVGATPFVGASDRNNGVTTWVGQEHNHSGNTISVSYNGSVAEAFYQPTSFWASDDVNILYEKAFEFNTQIGLFLCALIRREKYRFSYGRKWHLDRMKQSTILLPVGDQGKPDTAFMEFYINSLPYSSQI
jgi:hypothetical protein